MRTSRKWACGLLLFALGAAFAGVVWGESKVSANEAQILPAYFGHPEVAMTAGMHGEMGNLQIRIKQLDPEAERNVLRAHKEELKLSDAQVDGISIYAGVQVMQPVSVSAVPGKIEWKEVTDFRDFPDWKLGFLKGGVSAFILAFQFERDSKVPKFLYFIAGKTDGSEKVVKMATINGSMFEKGFDMQLERSSQGSTIVLILTVYQWPEGDPRCGGG